MRTLAFAVLCCLPCVAFGFEEPSVAQGVRSARLLAAELESDVTPAVHPALRALDGVRLSTTALPPLDDGGAVGGDTRKILALLLGLIPGFGLGHLVAKDKDGFVLFLLVDVAIIATGIILSAVARFHFIYLGLLVTHIIQGLDAYGEAGGERFLWAPGPETGQRYALSRNAAPAFALAF